MWWVTLYAEVHYIFRMVIILTEAPTFLAAGAADSISETSVLVTPVRPTVGYC